MTSITLTVFLENDTDKLLIQWAARVLDAEGSSQLLEALDQGWVLSDGRGGTGELLKSVESPVSMRCAAIIDSDRDHWADTPDKEDLIKESEKKGQIPVHILRGRELENYIPAAYWMDVVATGGPRGRPAERARENHLWRQLKATLERNESSYRSKHGARAFEAVKAEVEKKAQRKVSKATPRRLLDEYLQMAPEERAVDDLKARLGRKAALAVQRAESGLSNITVEDFDLPLIDDLRQLGRTLEEWL